MEYTFPGPKEQNCPTEVDRKKIGSPASTSMTKYGIKNPPPPFSYAKTGNLQMLPNPTA